MRKRHKPGRRKSRYAPKHVQRLIATTEEVEMVQLKDLAHDKEGEPVKYDPPSAGNYKVPVHPGDNYLDAAKAIWELAKAKAQYQIQEGKKTAWAETIKSEPGFMLELHFIELVRELWPFLASGRETNSAYAVAAELRRNSPKSIRTQIPGSRMLPSVIWYSEKWLDRNTYTPNPALQARNRPNLVTVTQKPATPASMPPKKAETVILPVSEPVAQSGGNGFSIESFLGFADEFRKMQETVKNLGPAVEEAKKFAEFKARLKELMEEYE